MNFNPKQIIGLILLLSLTACSVKTNKSTVPAKLKGSVPTPTAEVRELVAGEIEVTPSSSNLSEVVKDTGISHLSYTVLNKSSTPGKLKISSNSSFGAFQIKDSLTSCKVDSYKTLNASESCIVTVSFDSSGKGAGFYNSTFDVTDKYNGVLKSQDLLMLVAAIAEAPPLTGGCKTNYHMEGRVCIPNRRACIAPGFTAGYQDYSSVSSWGSCIATQCIVDFKLFGETGATSCVTCSGSSTHFSDATPATNMCISNTLVSAIPNGSCTQTWSGNKVLGSYGACQVSCNDQYTSDGVQCIRQSYAFATAKNKLAIGKAHSCRIGNDNKLRCFGDNSYGQLGLGFVGGNMPSQATNQYVDFSSFGAGLYPVDVSVTERSSCAILSDDSVKCWGDNANGQLGNGTRISSAVPVSVLLGLHKASIIKSSLFMTCAQLKTSNKLSCWGALTNISLPLLTISPTVMFTPFSSNGNPLPELILDKNTQPYVIKNFSTAGHHMCLIEDNTNNLFCDGIQNPFLPLYSTYGHYTFSRNGHIAMPENVTAMALASGYNNVCIAGSDNNVYCMGAGNNGVLLNNSLASSFPNYGSYTTSNNVYTNTSSGCSSPTGANCGTITSSNLTYQGMGLSLSNISLGANHACATFTDDLNLLGNTLKCWGLNSSYQLADNNIATKNYAGIGIEWGDAYTVKETSFAGSNNSSCVVMNDGVDTVKCFGDNSYGQLGFGYGKENNSKPQEMNTVTSRTKATVSSFVGMNSIASYGPNTCIIDSADNFVKCLGKSIPSSLYDINTSPAQKAIVSIPYVDSYYVNTLSGNKKIDFGGPVMQITSNYNDTICALLVDGSIKCLGNQAGYAIGNGINTGYAIVPTTPTGLTGSFKYISSNTSPFNTNSIYTTCAIKIDGSAYCWGGINQTAIMIAGISNATYSFSYGIGLNCFGISDGSLKCISPNAIAMDQSNPIGSAIAANTVATSSLAGAGNVIKGIMKIEDSSGYSGVCIILGGATVNNTIKCGTNSTVILWFSNSSYPFNFQTINNGIGSPLLIKDTTINANGQYVTNEGVSASNLIVADLSNICMIVNDSQQQIALNSNVICYNYTSGTYVPGLMAKSLSPIKESVGVSRSGFCAIQQDNTVACFSPNTNNSINQLFSNQTPLVFSAKQLYNIYIDR